MTHGTKPVIRAGICINHPNCLFWSKRFGVADMGKIKESWGTNPDGMRERTQKEPRSMNYLGHIYLSGNNDLLMVGNFIGDYVKGKQYLEYPGAIQKGILLHREIDRFTDTQDHWREIRSLIYPLYQRYSGIVADLFVDHFLATGWDRYSATPLPWFAKRVHAVFLQNHGYLPPVVRDFLPWFIQHRRLVSYAGREGIRESLYIMSLRSSLPDHSAKALDLLDMHYAQFYEYAHAFLERIIGFLRENEGIELPLPGSL